MSTSFLPFFHNLLSTGVISLGRYTVLVMNESAVNFERIYIDSINFTHTMFDIVQNPTNESRVELSHIDAGIYLNYENGAWFVRSKWSR
jgi:hypothetical protein